MSEQWRPTVQKQLSQGEARLIMAKLADVVLWTEAANTDMPRFIPAMNGSLNGIGSSFGGGGVSGGDVSDPTFSAVLARLDGRADRSADELATVSRCVAELHRAAQLLFDTVQRNLVDPTPRARRCREGDCPDGRAPASGRGGRCEACYRFWVRHDHKEDRDVAGGSRAAA